MIFLKMSLEFVCENVTKWCKQHFSLQTVLFSYGIFLWVLFDLNYNLCMNLVYAALESAVMWLMIPLVHH